MRPSVAERSCAYHEGRRGIAVCADCGAELCGECHGIDRRGYARCPRCRDEPIASQPEWEVEGTRYTPRSYAATLWQLLRYPRGFFREFAEDGPWLPATIFGFATGLVGILLGRLGKLAFDPDFVAALSDFGAAESLAPGALRALLLFSAPVSAALALGAHVAALRTAARVAGLDLGWSAAARIGGYSLGALLFLAVPPIYGVDIGGLLVIFWLFNLEASALEHRFDASPWRATFTVLLPILIAMVCAG